MCDEFRALRPFTDAESASHPTSRIPGKNFYLQRLKLAAGLAGRMNRDFELALALVVVLVRIGALAATPKVCLCLRNDSESLVRLFAHHHLRVVVVMLPDSDRQNTFRMKNLFNKLQ